MPVLLALWQANYSVYGARKLWVAARRAGHDIGRDQVARLMKRLDIRGAKREKRVRATRPNPAASRPEDLVERDFAAERPNRLRAADLTQVATWSGVAYVCFITDAFSRRIVGWRVASNMATQTVLDALEMARWSRGARLEGLVAHTDAGSQSASIRYTERLDDIGAVPSIGTVGDSYDNALAESVNSLFKAEPIRSPRHGPWRTVDRRRARHPRPGALVEHRPHPRLPRRPVARGVRSRLRCGEHPQDRQGKPKHSACAKPKVNQNNPLPSAAPLRLGAKPLIDATIPTPCDTQDAAVSGWCYSAASLDGGTAKRYAQWPPRESMAWNSRCWPLSLHRRVGTVCGNGCSSPFT